MQVNNFPAYVTVSNAKSYKACYYTIAPAAYSFKDGAQIKLNLTSAQNMQVSVFGGTSRTNASYTVLYQNQTLPVGTVVAIDASMGFVLVVRALDNKLSPTSFSFNYEVQGSQYSYLESLIIGPDGQTYFIAGVAIFSFIAAILLAAVIYGCYHCLHERYSDDKDNKVYDISNFNESAAGDSKTRNPGLATPRIGGKVFS